MKYMLVVLFFLQALSVLSSANEVCEKEKKYSQVWYYNNCDKSITKNGNKNKETNKVKIYKSWSIPQYVKPDPNLATIKHHFKKEIQLIKDPQMGWNKIKPSGNHKEFKKQLETNQFLKDQMNSSSILSYLYYEKGSLIYDEITPKNRLGKLYKNNTPWISNSVGKSIVSYLVGNAICEGKIEGINTKLNDWPLIKNTLYYDQKLIDILNMNAGDKNYVSDSDGMRSTKRWYNVHTIKALANRELKNSKPIEYSKRKHYYNGLATNIIINYLVHKTDYKFKDFLNKTFKDKVKNQHIVRSKKILFVRNDKNRQTKKRTKIKDGISTYTFYATRYDYLRIAKAMMDDWQKDTCVGKYLKDLAKNKIPKKRYIYEEKGFRFSSKSYAGQFYLDYLDLEERNIFGLDGYGGQNIMIDFDESRIIVINTVHTNYDFKRLVLDVLKYGRIK